MLDGDPPPLPPGIHALLLDFQRHFQRLVEVSSSPERPGTVSLSCCRFGLAADREASLCCDEAPRTFHSHMSLREFNTLLGAHERLWVPPLLRCMLGFPGFTRGLVLLLATCGPAFTMVGFLLFGGWDPPPRTARGGAWPAGTGHHPPPVQPVVRLP